MRLRVVVIRLSFDIKQSEISMFRGAVNAVLDRNKSALYHNHQGDGFRYSYPLIQYKRIGGKAAIVCLGDGAEAIYQFFDKQGVELMMGERNVECEVEEVVAKKFDIELTEENHSYRIRKWLPFNEDNYKEYINSDGLVERYRLLESILVGNILSFCKGLGLFLDGQLIVKLKDFVDENIVVFKGNKMMSFDIDFVSNISLPDFIGLGKGVSHGYGTTTNFEQRERRVI